MDKLTELVEERLNSVDMDQAYDDFLDEVHEGCSLCSQYGASRILQDVDPIAYRCGFSDYLDSERDRVEEINGDYYEVYEVDEIRDEIEAENNEDD